MAARDRFGGTAEGPGPAAQPGAGTGAPPREAPPSSGLEVYGDSAYGSGEARAAYRDAGHGTVIKPGPLRPAVPGGFTIDDFAVDEQAGAVTCPAGVTRPLTRTRTVTFGAACAGCPLRARCTTARDGRSMTIHPHEDLLRAARAQARTDEFKQAYPTRWRSSGSSPGPPPRTGGGSGSATSAPPRTTPGCTPGAPRSTCAPCCGTDSPPGRRLGTGLIRAPCPRAGWHQPSQIRQKPALTPKRRHSAHCRHPRHQGPARARIPDGPADPLVQRRPRLGEADRVRRRGGPDTSAGSGTIEREEEPIRERSVAAEQLDVYLSVEEAEAPADAAESAEMPDKRKAAVARLVSGQIRLLASQVRQARRRAETNVDWIACLRRSW